MHSKSNSWIQRTRRRILQCSRTVENVEEPFYPTSDPMKKYEYRITKHPSEEFRHIGFFCNEQGECNLEQVPGAQISILEKILNGQGEQGWELVQTSFGRDGIIAFWKREA